MTSQKNYKKFKKNCSNILVVLLSTAIMISACKKKDELDRSTIQGEAKYDARMTRKDIHAEYLQCYPLGPSEKAACNDELAEKYNKRKYREYLKYTREYQYESEKLGFKELINSHELECEGIFHGPEYVEKERAYLARCKPKGEYYIKFDYKTKKWSIK